MIDKLLVTTNIPFMNVVQKIARYSIPWLKRNVSLYGPRLLRRIKLVVCRRSQPDGILVAGPFVGELGYEIGEWIPHLAGLTNRLNCRLHVFANKGHQALYPFAEKIIPFDFSAHNVDCNWLRNPSGEQIELFGKYTQQAWDYCSSPGCKGGFRTIELCGGKQMFRVFDDKVPVKLCAAQEAVEKWKNELPENKKIVLTYRALQRGGERNSNPECIEKLAAFIIKKGWTPVLVGRIDSGFSVPSSGAVNLVNKTTLEDLIAIYRLSSVVVGSSTGIIHLAAACRVPHITWGSTFPDDTVVRRYNRDWNLNNTWVRFVSKDWDVDAEMIQDVLIQAAEIK